MKHRDSRLSPPVLADSRISSLSTAKGADVRLKPLPGFYLANDFIDHDESDLSCFEASVYSRIQKIAKKGSFLSRLTRALFRNRARERIIAGFISQRVVKGSSERLISRHRSSEVNGGGVISFGKYFPVREARRQTLGGAVVTEKEFYICKRLTGDLSKRINLF